MQEQKKDFKDKNMEQKKDSVSDSLSTAAEVVKESAAEGAVKVEHVEQKSEVAVSSVNTASSVESKPGSSKTIFAFIAGVLVAFAAYALFNTFSAPSTDGFKDDQEIAKVNGEKLLGLQLNQQMEQFALVRGLENLEAADELAYADIEAQALDALINTELIVQAAKHEGITIDDEEISTEYDRLVESIGGQEAADARFAELGTSAGDFRASLQNELMVAKYMQGAVPEERLVVSAEEIESFYTEAVATMGDAAPALEEVSVVIEEQIRVQKQQEALVELLEQLREDALIEKLI